MAEARSAWTAPIAALAVLGIVLVAAVLAGSLDHTRAAPVSTSAGVTSSTVSTDPVVARLQKIVDDAVRRYKNTGTIHAQAVLSTRAVSQELLSGDEVGGTEAVWAIQIESTTEFVCDSCTGPVGAPAPRGHVVQISVRADNFAGEDGGLQDTVVDLSKLGKVVVLRP